MKTFETHPAAMERRTLIKWVMAASAATAAGSQFGWSAAPAAPAAGYGTAPDLLKKYSAGDCWPLTLSAAEKATAALLCDVIIPADDQGPSASSVKVPDFIDEWVSAPYPGHDRDRKLITEGLAWIEAEAQRRFQNDFGSLVVRQRNAICDDICHAPDAKPEFRAAARFFARFRDLCASGYYTTPAGMKDIGYVGNVALERFDGPPPEVRRKLGLS
jgi:hypothetical protein